MQTNLKNGNVGSWVPLFRLDQVGRTAAEGFGFLEAPDPAASRLEACVAQGGIAKGGVAKRAKSWAGLNVCFHVRAGEARSRRLCCSPGQTSALGHSQRVDGERGADGLVDPEHGELAPDEIAANSPDSTMVRAPQKSAHDNARGLSREEAGREFDVAACQGESPSWIKIIICPSSAIPVQLRRRGEKYVRDESAPEC
jgi:hypothetical protein